MAKEIKVIEMILNIDCMWNRCAAYSDWVELSNDSLFHLVFFEEDDDILSKYWATIIVTFIFNVSYVDINNNYSRFCQIVQILLFNVRRMIINSMAIDFLEVNITTK